MGRQHSTAGLLPVGGRMNKAIVIPFVLAAGIACAPLA
jgi:hypothetical protein